MVTNTTKLICKPAGLCNESNFDLFRNYYASNKNAVLEHFQKHSVVGYGNTKLGAQIGNINQLPGATCRKFAPCYSQGCYALNGRFSFSTTKLSLYLRYLYYKFFPVEYFAQIQKETANFLPGTVKYIRYHSAGDIVDYKYLYNMITVASANKNTVYLCFTKRYEIVNEYCNKNGKDSIPQNLVIVFSHWASLDCPNPYKFPVVYVSGISKEEDSLIPASAIPCGGKCYSCAGCWKLKSGDSVVIKKHR